MLSSDPDGVRRGFRFKGATAFGADFESAIIVQYLTNSGAPAKIADMVLRIRGSSDRVTDADLRAFLDVYADWAGDSELQERLRDGSDRLAEEVTGLIKRLRAEAIDSKIERSDRDAAMSASTSSPMTNDYLDPPRTTHTKGTSDQAMLASASSPMAMDFLGTTRAHRPDPMRQVQPIIDDMNRLLKEHRFSDARAAIGRLPRTVSQSARNDILRQIDEAEKGFETQHRIAATVEQAQLRVNDGDFVAARKLMEDLPSDVDEIQKVKGEVIANIDRFERESERAEREIPGLLSRLESYGVLRPQIDEIAESNSFDTRQPLQLKSLLDQIISQVEG